ncbi:aspartyl protease family protein [Marchantia polymorpha subsp. ruderalis]|nr:hypothetical protein MARPO_0143s0038 [Marchantia polymorpha]BBN11464.1 hypothetical protein Mp_5g12090 [Marchantia polymorpha subsp. ruderalis]|eukprot:PTQ29363.1 hypothetical protein MARPO_0143s0038 [Marchantia polymorpha]
MAAIRSCVEFLLLATVALVHTADPSLATENVKAPFVGLKHLDYHQDSPLHDAHTTFVERIHTSVRRSEARASAFRSIVAAGITPRGTHFDSTVEVSSKAASSFQSAVSAAPGGYIMSISLGSPPQTRTAIADTGSDLVWLQCAPCSVCFRQSDPLFDPRKSATFTRIRYFSPLCGELPQVSYDGGFCTYRYGYGDQSTTQGDFALETLTLTAIDGSTQSINNFAFGCGRRNQGTFAGTDGLVGLGRGAISFTEQIGSRTGSKFAYCLVDAGTSGSEVSPLIFGDSAAETGNALNLSYTPLIRNPAADTFYYVKLNGISVNGQPVAGIPANAYTLNVLTGRGGVILDSGTTITQLVQSAYIRLLTVLQSLIAYPQVDGSPVGLDLCYDVSGVSSPSLPSVTLQFQGIDVVLPADNVFLQVDAQGTMCLAFAGTSDFSIIGNIQQQNFYYLYDVENERVGIAPLDKCAALASTAASTGGLLDEL